MFVKRNQVGVRLDDEELARLKKLASELGLSPTDSIRFLVKREYDARIVSKRAHAA